MMGVTYSGKTRKLGVETSHDKKLTFQLIEVNVGDYNSRGLHSQHRHANQADCSEG
jgi:hypothetical protein